MTLPKSCGDSFSRHNLQDLPGWYVDLESWEEGSIPWHRCVGLSRVTKEEMLTSLPIQLSEHSAVVLQQLISRTSAVSSWILTLPFLIRGPRILTEAEKKMAQMWNEFYAKQTREMIEMLFRKDSRGFLGPGSKKG